MACDIYKLTAEHAYLSHDRGLDPHCRMCQPISIHTAPAVDMVHLLTMCWATADTRFRVMSELLNSVAQFHPTNKLLSEPSHDHLTQCILDCSSNNLPSDTCVPPNQKGFKDIYKQCIRLTNERSRQLKAMGHLT